MPDDGAWSDETPTECAGLGLYEFIQRSTDLRSHRLLLSIDTGQVIVFPIILCYGINSNCSTVRLVVCELQLSVF